MMGTGLELVPVGILVSQVCDQLAKIALAAQDIRSEKSFKQLGDYLNNIRKLLSKLDAPNESPLLVGALNSLKGELDKAERLVLRYRDSSFFSNILHCRSICDTLQKAMRDIGKSLQLLGDLCNVYDVGVKDSTRNALMLLESEMIRAEVRVSSESLQILDALQAAIVEERADRIMAVELLEKIAYTHGVLPEPRMMDSELSKFRKDIEEAKERKERQEVKYMEQLLSLLSLEDSALELEASERNYKELKHEIIDSVESLSVNEPSSQFICSLTRQVMDEPVILKASGKSYERKAIQTRFDAHDFTDPASGQPLQDHDLRPNYILARAIKVWRQQNCAARIIQARNKLETDQERALNDLMSLCKENPDCKDWIVFEGLVPIILEVVRARNKELRVLCFSTLELVVKDRDHAKDKLLQSRGLKYIVKNLSAGGHSVSRAAISLLLEFIKNKSVVLTQFGQERGAVLLLVTVLLRGDHADRGSEIEQMLDKLADNLGNIQAMVMGNWCKPLVDRLCRGSAESKMEMAKALAKFDLDDSRRESLIDAHVIEALVDILKSRQLESKLASLKALEKLSCHDKAKRHFVESGAVPWVIDSVHRSEQRLKSSAVAILADLTANHGESFLVDANGTPIHIKEIVELVIEIIRSFGNLTLRTNSAKVLLNLAAPTDSHDVRKIISSSDQCLATFLHLAKVAEPSLRDVSVLLLFSLCSNDTDAVSFVSDDRDFLKALLFLIKEDSVKMDLRAAAAGIFSSIPSNNTVDKLMIGEDAFPALVKMISGKDLEGQEYALGALIRFTTSEHVEAKRVLIELGLFDHLKQVLQSGRKGAKIKACIALTNISRNTPRLSIEPQRRSFRLSRKSSIKCKVHGGRCSLKDTFCIVEAGIVPDIVETLKDHDAGVALAGMEVLETLLEGDMLINGVQVLHQFETIEHLFPLINLNSCICSEKCVDLFDMILKVSEMKEKYGQRVQRTLTSLLASRNSSLKQKACKLFREIAD
ncbi:U-box domain-containing protein 44 isoform X1 [Cryptomeria japonica]|uniref:U-box domain-containing protein 44 isoform X1 n=1 Tax=Cryptomeria japonica TaxID=3369 RepID=UPI0027DA66C8|nr:U-box domain-containing protein 44 isoform X1 [Cryptomeria japonica]XP_057842748.2 U-box domain-containing protein 44 isoform X1 [Cryptomeria japonica]